MSPPMVHIEAEAPFSHDEIPELDHVDPLSDDGDSTSSASSSLSIRSYDSCSTNEAGKTPFRGFHCFDPQRLLLCRLDYPQTAEVGEYTMENFIDDLYQASSHSDTLTGYHSQLRCNYEVIRHIGVNADQRFQHWHCCNLLDFLAHNMYTKHQQCALQKLCIPDIAQRIADYLPAPKLSNRTSWRSVQHLHNQTVL